MLLTFRRNVPLFSVLFLLVTLQVHALPQSVHRTREEFVRKQDAPFNGPQTVETVTTTNTCVVTFLFAGTYVLISCIFRPL